MGGRKGKRPFITSAKVSKEEREERKEEETIGWLVHWERGREGESANGKERKKKVEEDLEVWGGKRKRRRALVFCVLLSSFSLCCLLSERPRGWRHHNEGEMDAFYTGRDPAKKDWEKKKREG